MSRVTSIQFRERWLVYFLLLLLHVALMLSFFADHSPDTDAALTGFPLDDAWIHLVYGRAIAQTGLPCYNEGVLEAGFTSPLWMVFLALAELIHAALSLPVVIVVKILGTLLAWISSLAVFELARRLSSSLSMALIASVLAAANPASVFAQMSGMEVALTSALLVLTILAFAFDRWRLSSILLGLSFLARPESILLLPILVVVYWFSTRRTEMRSPLKPLVTLILPTALGALIWSGYCLAVTDHPLPNTFYAKYSGTDPFGGFLAIVSDIVLQLPAMHVGAGIVLFLIGTAAMIYRRSRASLVVLVLPWLFLAGIASTRSMPPGCGDYFYWWRYVAPVLPLLLLPLAVGGACIAQPGKWFQSFVVGARTSKMLKLIAIAFLLVCLVGYPSELKDFKTLFAWNCQNINEVQVEIGKWVKRNISKDAAVVAVDAGAIRYFGEHRTVDMLGLNNHELLSQPTLLYEINVQPDSLADYMQSVGATHCIIFPETRPSLVGSPAFPQLFSQIAEFSSPYYTVASSLQTNMVVYGLSR